MKHQDLIPQDKLLGEIARLVGPLREFPINEPGLSDSSRSMRWIKKFTNTERYAGKWVALRAGRVVAEANSYAELSGALDGYPHRNECIVWQA
jgi:hypothetical protein